jgi:putative SOS response-associated peptidase YedK
MCGRFALSPKTKDIEHLVPRISLGSELKPRYNIAPTQDIACIMSENPGELSFLRWGLIPSWSKDESIGSKMINARSETINEKPSFRNAFRKRRCLIIASGFYEWKKTEGVAKKSPYYIYLSSGLPFTFAGVWESWKKPETGERINSTSIITTFANELMLGLHDRMPVIIHPDNYDLWLDSRNDDHNELLSILKPYPSEEMECYAVSDLVNNPRNDSEDCIKPLQ